MQNTLFHPKSSFRSWDIYGVVVTFGYVVETRLDINIKTKFNYKICDITDWTTNNYNAHIA